MGLLEQHQAERRARILEAARRLIAARGFDGLTMRDLARASRVSVPTLYNLFGGKHALLLGELEATFDAVLASTGRADGSTFVERAFAGCEAGNRDLFAAPRYSRELVHLFLTADETRPLRRAIGERYVELMAGVLRDGQAAGELVAWAEPTAVAERMYAHYLPAMIQWALGDLDDEGFRAATFFGMCLVLLGLARGRAAGDLERRARAVQPLLAPARRRALRKSKGG